MTTRVVLLRGVNVAGSGTRLPMASLRSLLEGLGCRDVRTYVQSGNAVLKSDLSPGDLAARIGDAVKLPNGTHPVTLVLTADELRAALEANPFDEASGDPKTLHLAFLDREVTPDLSGLAARAGDGERFALLGRVFYIYTPGGFGRSHVASRMEAALRPTRVTARNLVTVTALDRMAQGLA